MNPEVQRVTINGIGIACFQRDVAGPEGSPLLFVHGLGSSSREMLYLSQDNALRSSALFFVDFPGFGSSDKPKSWSYSIEDQADTLAAFISARVSGAVTIVGHSMGGSIAIATAMRHPHLVSRLIVAEPNLDPGKGGLSGHIARQSESRFVERGYRALVYQTRRQAERGDAVASRFLVTLQEASPIALHRSAVSLRAHRSPTLREQFEAIDIPRVTITGANTPPLDPPLTDPEITHYLIDHAGHVMMVENPEAFAIAVRSALATT